MRSPMFLTRIAQATRVALAILFHGDPQRPANEPPAEPAPVVALPLTPTMRIRPDFIVDDGPNVGTRAFQVARPAPGVVPGIKPGDTMAMDDAMSAALGWAGTDALDEGLSFMGYPYLAQLTQRPEYRRPSEIIAKEMTRKWIRFVSTGDEDKTEVIAKIEAEFKRLKVQDKFKQAAELDGFFGRGQIYIGVDGASPEEVAMPLSLSKHKLANKKLSLRVIEPIWTYPDAYNSSDPLRDDFYRPQAWFVFGKRVHASRMLTFVSRDVPDILKPAYGFGGLSLSQMAKPYIDNWLRTRQSVSDAVHNFSVMVLKTNLSSVLNNGGATQMALRAQLFNTARDNNGLMMVDMNEEDFANVSMPLGGLDHLQAQSQEQMSAVTGIPLVVLLGITPSGLNASTEGERDTFDAWTQSQQATLFSPPLDKVLDVVQLSLFGAIDPAIGYVYEPLQVMSDADKAGVEKTKVETDGLLIDKGVIDPLEARTRLANDADSFYTGLDLDKQIEAPGAGGGEGDGGEGGFPGDAGGGDPGDGGGNPPGGPDGGAKPTPEEPAIKAEPAAAPNAPAPAPPAPKQPRMASDAQGRDEGGRFASGGSSSGSASARFSDESERAASLSSKAGSADEHEEAALAHWGASEAAHHDSAAARHHEDEGDRHRRAAQHMRANPGATAMVKRYNGAATHAAGLSQSAKTADEHEDAALAHWGAAEHARPHLPRLARRHEARGDVHRGIARGLRAAGPSMAGDSWVEGDHDRAPNGQFGSGSGAAVSPADHPAAAIVQKASESKAFIAPALYDEAKRTIALYAKEESPTAPLTAEEKTKATDQLAIHLAAAHAAKPAYDAKLKAIGEKIGARVMLAGIKGGERLLEKHIRENGNNPAEMKDLVRGSLVVNSLDEVRGALAAIGQNFTIARKKDRFAKPLNTGYSDMLINIKLPGGILGEVQIHIPEMLATKGELGHALYDIERKLPKGNALKGQLVELQSRVYGSARAAADQVVASKRLTPVVIQDANSSRVSSSPSMPALDSFGYGLDSASGVFANAMHEPSGNRATGMPSTSRNSAPSGTSVSFTAGAPKTPILPDGASAASPFQGLALDAWEEGDHQRAANGQFGSGGGESSHSDAGLADKVSALFKDNLGTVRGDMPQIPNKHKAQFLNELAERGIKSTPQRTQADTLKPTQRDFNLENIKHLQSAPPKGNPILVSNDGRVLDGHHRWVISAMRGEPIDTIHVDMPMHALLKEAKSFNDKMGIEGRTAAQSSAPVDSPAHAHDSLPLRVAAWADRRRAAMAMDDEHWITTETGSHLLLSHGGVVIGGAGGHLNGKVLSPKSKGASRGESESGKKSAAATSALQNRNRSSAASISQMNKIASNPNPRLLMASPTMADGAPVVSDLAGNGIAKLTGKRDYVVTHKREIPFRYAVVEADQLSASNRADGTKNDDYAADPDKLTAINNGRTAGLVAAYERGTAADYKKAIAKNEHIHGIPAAAIRKMKAPVLVRVMDASDVDEHIGDESNSGMTLALSATEQAQNDAARFDPTAVDYDDDGAPSHASVKGFINAMPESERQSLAPNGKPTKQAIDRMMAATFHAAYGDTELVGLMAQATDPESRNLIGGLSRAAGSMAKLKDAGNLDVRDLVTGAAKQIINAVRSGVSIKKFLSQGDLLTSGPEDVIAGVFAQHARSAKAIGEKLSHMATFALEQSQSGGTDMFGEEIPVASREAVLETLHHEH